MKIVIDIPEEVKQTFDNAKNEDLYGNYYDYNSLIGKAIQNGTPLPKGHRFIDADEILNHAFIRDDEEGDIFVQKYYCIKKGIVDNALVLFDTLEEGKEQ